MNPNYPSLWSQPQPSADPLKPVIDPAPPYESRPNSLADLGVADILERYQHDTELLKHILMAKAEEDKVNLNPISLDFLQLMTNTPYSDAQQRRYGWLKKLVYKQSTLIYSKGAVNIVVVRVI